MGRAQRGHDGLSLGPNALVPAVVASLGVLGGRMGQVAGGQSLEGRPPNHQWESP